MSDYVKIKVTYPNSETDPAAAGASRGISPASPDGGTGHSRRASPVLFAVIGLIVVVGGIAAGVAYTRIVDPVVRTADADPSSPTPSKATVAAPATTPVADAPEKVAQDDTAASGAGDEDVARFETAAPAPASGTGVAAPIPTASVPQADGASVPQADGASGPQAENALSRPEAKHTGAGEEPAVVVAALPPPVKRPAAAGAVPSAAASPGGSVARSQLTSAVRAREPVDRLSSRVKIGDGGRRKLYYFTELKGLSGETVFHRWEHDGRTMVTLRFDIGGDRWRAYSSKTIPANQRGDWRVVVANAEGDVLASSQFIAE